MTDARDRTDAAAESAESRAHATRPGAAAEPPQPPGHVHHPKAKHGHLSRPVRAVAIPDGNEVTLPKDTTFFLTQNLGTSFTIQLVDNRKFRIEGSDGDAIGQEAKAQVAKADQEPLSADAAEKRAWELLKTVHDPEIPVDVVSLGLVYTVKMHERGDKKLLAEVRMSLTAPGCGMGDVLIGDVQRLLDTIPGVAAIDAKIVFDPIWNPNMMSDAAKLKLGLL